MNKTKQNGGVGRNALPQARSAYRPTHTNKENKKTPKQNKNGAGAQRHHHNTATKSSDRGPIAHHCQQNLTATQSAN